MEEILEIRDGCTTPSQLLKSKAFSKFLNIYKHRVVHDFYKPSNSFKYN